MSKTITFHVSTLDVNYRMSYSAVFFFQLGPCEGTDDPANRNTSCFLFPSRDKSALAPDTQKGKRRAALFFLQAKLIHQPWIEMQISRRRKCFEN